MPRPGPPRPIVSIRLSTTGIERIDALAKARGLTRSEMIRQLLRAGIAHMAK